MSDEFHVVGSVSPDTTDHITLDSGRILVHDESRDEVLIAAPNGGKND